MNIHIDWNKLSQLPDSDNISFEKFCFHIARVKFAKYGTVSYFYNTPGSEFYVELNKPLEYEGKAYEIGDVIGWQAKFWRGVKDNANSPLGADHKKELEEGFKKTNDYRPNIKLWIVCTPGSFVQKEWDKLLVNLSSINSDCNITSWHRDIFEGFLVDEPQMYNGIFQYHFGQQYIGKASVNSVSTDTLECLKTKFDTDLHTPSDFERNFLAVVDNGVLVSTLKKTIISLKRHIDKESKHEILNENHWGYQALTGDFRDAYQIDVDKRKNLCNELQELVQQNASFDVDNIQKIVNTYIKERRERVNILNGEIKKILKNNRNEYRNLNYYLNELADKVKKAEDYVSSKEKHESIVSLLDFYSQKDFSVFAEAGFGKTHLACSLAENCINRDLPVLFLMGSSFRNCGSVESKIRELLQLPLDLSIGDILDSLDFLATINKCKVPIIIDGLNEAAPKEGRWREELPPLIRKIREREHLVLITTCREKTDYLQVIYGKENYKQVDNYVLLKGIASEDLDVTVSRYFKKYDIHPINTDVPADFSNPLLIKVFCLTNKGLSNFKLDEYSLSSCMKTYSNRMIQAIATKDGRIDILAKHQLEIGLNRVAQIIWKNNIRCINLFEEFVPAFGKDYYEAFLNEGMCFMMDRNNGEEQIQFSYDMVAGYHIAKSIVSLCPTSSEFKQYVECNKSKFFGTERHTLAEDVNKSLFYLVFQKYNQQWFELMNDSDVLLSGIDHLDIILSEKQDPNALAELLSRKIDCNLKQKLLDALYRRSVELGNLSYFSSFIPFFRQLSPKEWDMFWNCKMAEYGPLQKAYSILNDRYHSDRFRSVDRLCFASILCGVTDLEYRRKYYFLVQKYSWLNFTDASEILHSLLFVHDTFIFESVLSVITGAGLRTSEKCVIQECIGMLEDFLQTYTSNHIVLLDDLDTLYAYAEHRFQLTYDRHLLSKNRTEVWSGEIRSDYDYCSFYSYDFDKYNIRCLYESYDDTILHYTADEIYGMLHSKIASLGYDVDAYHKLEQVENNKARYRSSLKCSYSHKYGRHALMELYGWLLLNDYLKSEYKGTFRTAIIDIDPSAPHFTPLRSLFSQSFLCRNICSVDKWLSEESCIDMMANLTNVSLPNHEDAWILLCGDLSQKAENNCSNLYLARTCYLVPKEMSEDQISKLYLSKSVDFNHAFAGELGWRMLEEQESYDDENACEILLAQYSFSSWDQGRFQYSHFFMLNPKIARAMNLTFDVERMNYFMGDDEVSAYFVNDKDHFFFLRKDVLDLILKRYNAKVKCHIYDRRFVDKDLPKEAPIISSRYVEKSKDIIID